MSVTRINATSVPEEGGEELARRFGERVGAVASVQRVHKDFARFSQLPRSPSSRKGGSMREQIDRIVWNEKQMHMRVAYVEREPLDLVADQLVATKLAEDAGLVLVTAPPGTVQWMRDPDTRDGS